MAAGPRTSTATHDKPELLAPAGGRAQLEAAVWAGADAVYLGLDRGLNARARATSFTLAGLPETMGYLHERGVKGYLTLNTLVFDEELTDAEQLIRHAASAGVDALIVQDIGLVRLAREIAPHLPIHGSTQMSITDAAGVAFAADLGVKRVVLGRELSIDEITRIAQATELELEAFVHGALCVSYSGQCFSSEAWGGRSANRGQCAQACRLPYGLLVDGELREQGDQRYLLSPQDLMALELLPRLVRTGLRCFKIEGRLKGPEYVVATVSAYREALDRIWPDDAVASKGKDSNVGLSRQRRRHLAQVFSRGQSPEADGLTTGFLEGPRHQFLVIGRNPRHRGVCVGTVSAVGKRGVTVQLSGPVKRGDGLVFDRGRPEDREYGGNVHHVIDRNGESLTTETEQGPVELRFGPEFPLKRINAGDIVWRTRDGSLDAGTRLDARLAARRPVVQIKVGGKPGRPMSVVLRDTQGRRAEAVTTSALTEASAAPLDRNRIAKAIGQLGDTVFALGELVIDLPDDGPGLFIPLGEIKAARRAAVEKLLTERRSHHRDRGLAVDPVLPMLLPTAAPETPVAARISLLCRTRDQVEAALLDPGIDDLILDFLEVHGLKEACEAVRHAGRRLIVAAPRILKPGEERLVRYLCRLEPDALLVRSAGLLQRLIALGGPGALLEDRETPIPALHGDFSLNAANVLSATQLLELGIDRLALTHDLNARQAAALARALPAEHRERLELIAHHHLPIFHTEYCAFARFLSRGNSFRDCGRPCERHIVHLRDPAGKDHLVQADIGCRNTVFNAEAQSAAGFLPDLQKAGIGLLRIELVDEPASEVQDIVNAYLRHLAGDISSRALQNRLSRVTDANGHAQGVGPGSLAVRLELPRERMKKPTAR